MGPLWRPFSIFFVMTSISSPSKKYPASVMCRKILCSAFEAAPFPEKKRQLFAEKHAYATIRTIKRHLEESYQLIGLETRTETGRRDLIFAGQDGHKRISEVKSGHQITEADKIQAALYWEPGYDEVVVSTRFEDLLLPPTFICKVRVAARLAMELLITQPEVAATKFTPHPAACSYCANKKCAFSVAETYVRR